MKPTLANARWYADVRAEALDKGIHVSMVEAMDRHFTEMLGELVAKGLLSERDATAVTWGLGMEDAPPNVGEPVRRFIVASYALNFEGAELDPFELYAKGLEQDLAAARQDYARQLNPTPRKDYSTFDDLEDPRPHGIVLPVIVLAVLGLAVLGGRRRKK